MAIHTPLLQTNTLTVLDLRCAAPRGGCGAERGDEEAHLALVRQGAFGYHLGRHDYLADATTGLFHAARHSYRVSHPLEGGDCCTVIVCNEAMVEEIFGTDAGNGRRVEFTMDTHAQLAHLSLWHALGTDPTEPLDSEERVLELIERMRRLHRPEPRSGVARRRLLQQVRDVRVMLASQLDCNIAIDTLASAVKLSPFHLMRAFRTCTGLTLRAYRRRLRVSTALASLVEGCNDLSRLALDLGFASHSHMDAAFRQELQLAPTDVRRELANARRNRLRRFMQATREPPE